MRNVLVPWWSLTTMEGGIIYTGMLSAARNEQTSKEAVRDAAQGNVSDPLLVHGRLVFHQGGDLVSSALGANF